MFKYAVIFVVAALTSVISTPLVERLARRSGVTDLPGERRVNIKPIARLGGIAVFFSVVVTFALAFAMDRQGLPMLIGHSRKIAVLLGAAGIVLLFGAVDDIVSL